MTIIIRFSVSDTNPSGTLLEPPTQAPLSSRVPSHVIAQRSAPHRRVGQLVSEHSRWRTYPLGWCAYRGVVNAERDKFLLRASGELDRVQEILLNDPGLDEEALARIVRIASDLVHEGRRLALSAIAHEAAVLRSKAQGSGNAVRHIDVVLKLELWHVLIGLKRRIKNGEFGA
jgi:hypothetical protein